MKLDPANNIYEVSIHAHSVAFLLTLIACAVILYAVYRSPNK